MTTAAIRELVRADCARETNAFGAAFFDQHIEVVVRYGLLLAERIGADAETVELAGWLHDLAAVRDSSRVPTHAADSALLARELLAGHPKAEAVCRTIASHSAPVRPEQGGAEEVCLSHADVMSHIARPAYWLFYLYRVRGVSYEQGLAWLRDRVERGFSELAPEARALIAAERASAVRLLESAG